MASRDYWHLLFPKNASSKLTSTEQISFKKIENGCGQTAKIISEGREQTAKMIEKGCGQIAKMIENGCGHKNKMTKESCEQKAAILHIGQAPFLHRFLQI